jgi:hypothetical protein
MNETPKIPAGNGSIFTDQTGRQYRLANVNARRQTATIIRATPKLSKAERKAQKRAQRR